MPADRTQIRKEVQTYAAVLLQAAQGQDTVFDVYDQLVEATKLLRGSNDLRDALADAAIPLEKRQTILQEVFKDFDPALVQALCLMLERDEADLLPRIAEEYGAQVEETLKVCIVEVVTAIELDDALRDKIRKKLSADLGRDIVLREKVDPSILGGIVMSTQGKRIDASILSQLEEARIVLSTVPSGGEE